MTRLALATLALAACDSTTLEGPTVSVYRHARASCVVQISDGSGADPALAADLGAGCAPVMCQADADCDSSARCDSTRACVPTTCMRDSDCGAGSVCNVNTRACDARHTTTTLLAGLDVVDVVIDYGALDISASSTIPLPTPVVTVDGVATTITPPAHQRRMINNHIWFVATFTAPAVVSSDVQVRVPVIVGYATDERTVYATATPAGLGLAVYRQTPSGCLEQLSSAAASSDLGLATCASSPPLQPTLLAGLDTLELVVDDGVVGIPDDVQLPTPAPIVMVNGTAASTTAVATIGPVMRGHRFYTSTFPAPSVVSSNVELGIPLALGVVKLDPAFYQTVAPTAAVAILRRTTAGCYETISSAPLGMDVATSFPACPGAPAHGARNMLAGLNWIAWPEIHRLTADRGRIIVARSWRRPRQDMRSGALGAAPASSRPWTSSSPRRGSRTTWRSGGVDVPSGRTSMGGQ